MRQHIVFVLGVACGVAVATMAFERVFGSCIRARSPTKAPTATERHVGGRQDVPALGRPRPEEYVVEYGAVVPPLRGRAFFAIPIAPNGHGHEEARRTWLQWVADSDDADYRFFTDRRASAEWLAANDDVVVVDIQCERIDGCEMHSHTRNAETFARLEMHGNLFNRAMMRWALAHSTFTHYVRTDTDAFVCVERFMRELRTWPSHLFAAGAYHCVWSTRIDEAFMVVTRDLVDFYARHVGTTLRYYDRREAFENNFAHFLLSTYARLHDDKAHMRNYPSYIADSPKGSAYDIQPPLAGLVANHTADARHHVDVVRTLCTRYTVVHPLKAPGLLDAIMRSLELPATYPPPVAHSLNCSAVRFADGLRRPERQAGFDVPLDRSYWSRWPDKDVSAVY